MQIEFMFVSLQYSNTFSSAKTDISYVGSLFGYIKQGMV